MFERYDKRTTFRLATSIPNLSESSHWAYQEQKDNWQASKGFNHDEYSAKSANLPPLDQQHGHGDRRARVGPRGGYTWPSPRLNSSSARPTFNHDSMFTYVKPPAAEWRLGDGQGRETSDVNARNRKTWDLSISDNMRYVLGI